MCLISYRPPAALAASSLVQHAQQQLRTTPVVETSVGSAFTSEIAILIDSYNYKWVIHRTLAAPVTVGLNVMVNNKDDKNVAILYSSSK